MKWARIVHIDRMRIRAIGMICIAVATSLVMSMGTVQVPAGRSSELRTSDHRGDVIVTAFQYNWRSVARECTQVLGPAGVGYVQVSPPQESIPGSSWWTSYQPVSYALDSKEGTASEFRDMIRQCRAAGVGVVVDAVINYTTGVDRAQGVGTAGNTYTNTGDFPAVPYTAKDFHSCAENIMNYRDVKDVQECRVSGLQDLDTSSAHVRPVLAQYFATLLDLGVSGFRVDGVKHIASDDVLAIKKLVAKKTGRSIDDIWWMQEVIGNANEAEEIQPDRYLRSGQVSEFQYAYRLKRLFDDSLMGGSLTLDEITSNLVSGSQASVFVTNWDTERDGSTLTYKDGDRYTLATAFMLAYPYGSVNVFSGYRFTDRDGLDVLRQERVRHRYGRMAQSRRRRPRGGLAVGRRQRRGLRTGRAGLHRDEQLIPGFPRVLSDIPPGGPILQRLQERRMFVDHPGGRRRAFFRNGTRGFGRRLPYSLPGASLTVRRDRFPASVRISRNTPRRSLMIG